TFTSSELVQVGIELEIAFRLEQALPARDDPEFSEKLKAAVVAYPVIEVVDTRLSFLETCHPMMKLADNQANAGLVFGAPVADWQTLDVTNPGHKFTADEAIVSEGAGTVPGGSAFEILESFVRVVGDHCGGLQVGQLVTTGALSGLHWIEKGQTVRGQIAGLGSVEVVIGS
ncbi:MAG: 2-keto-4-pentenoate hydratase, partial [Pseudomonadota bacterium]